MTTPLPGASLLPEMLEKICSRLEGAPKESSLGFQQGDARTGQTEGYYACGPLRNSRERAQRDCIFVRHAARDICDLLAHIAYLEGPLCDALALGEADQFRAGMRHALDLAAKLVDTEYVGPGGGHRKMSDAIRALGEPPA